MGQSAGSMLGAGRRASSTARLWAMTGPVMRSMRRRAFRVAVEEHDAARLASKDGDRDSGRFANHAQSCASLGSSVRHRATGPSRAPAVSTPTGSGSEQLEIAEGETAFERVLDLGSTLTCDRPRNRLSRAHARHELRNPHHDHESGGSGRPFAWQCGPMAYGGVGISLEPAPIVFAGRFDCDPFHGPGELLALELAAASGSLIVRFSCVELPRIATPCFEVRSRVLSKSGALCRIEVALGVDFALEPVEKSGAPVGGQLTESRYTSNACAASRARTTASLAALGAWPRSKRRGHAPKASTSSSAHTGTLPTRSRGAGQRLADTQCQSVVSETRQRSRRSGPERMAGVEPGIYKALAGLLAFSESRPAPGQLARS